MSRLISRIARRDDEGLSLVELMVSIVIFGMIGAALTATVIITSQTVRNTSARADDLNNVQVALEDMTKLIATAANPPVPAGQTQVTALITAKNNDLSFYGYNKPGQAPSLIRFYVDSSNQLIESYTPSSQCVWPYTWDTTQTRSRVLARNLTPGQTVFTYFAAPTTPYPQGSPLPLTGSPAALDTTTSSPLVEEVGLSLSVDVVTAPDIPPTVATTQILLPNHQVDAQLLPESAC
jgi:prepilin-type N-terminal cleavage/methylation domain-containing protein